MIVLKNRLFVTKASTTVHYNDYKIEIVAINSDNLSYTHLIFCIPDEHCLLFNDSSTTTSGIVSLQLLFHNWCIRITVAAGAVK